jgi:hypothetical protein
MDVLICCSCCGSDVDDSAEDIEKVYCRKCYMNAVDSAEFSEVGYDRYKREVESFKQKLSEILNKTEMKKFLADVTKIYKEKIEEEERERH